MRQRDRDKRPARGPATHQPKRRLLVVCEGERTEPEYLRGLQAHVRNPLVHIELPPERGEPRRLVELAKQLRDEARRAARRERDDHLAFDEVWCAFDRDAHERFHEAVKMAQDNGLLLAVSNPCVELWLLLHLQDQPGAQDRHQLRRRLRDLLPSYDKGVRFADFAAGLRNAEDRAERLDADAARRDDGPFPNPSTSFYRLTRSVAGRAAPD